MKKKRFTDEQSIKILDEVEKGAIARDVCRKHNATVPTFYRWRNRYGGMAVSEAKRLRALERENTGLKKLVTDLTLDNRMLKDVDSRTW